MPHEDVLRLVPLLFSAITEAITSGGERSLEWIRRVDRYGKHVSFKQKRQHSTWYVVDGWMDQLGKG